MLRLMRSTAVGMGQIRILVWLAQIDHETQWWLQFINLSTG